MLPSSSTDIQQIVTTSVARATLLAQCERDIEEGMAAFLRLGNALRRIRDKKLYIDTHHSFEAYCQGRWRWTPRQAYNLMSAAQSYEVIEQSQPEALPVNEYQLRPLQGASDEDKPEIWREATESARGEGLSQPSQRHVAQAIERRSPAAPRLEPVPGPAPAPKPARIVPVVSAEDILGTELEVMRLRCQHLEALIASVIAEYGQSGALSPETLQRLEAEILPDPMSA